MVSLEIRKKHVWYTTKEDEKTHSAFQRLDLQFEVVEVSGLQSEDFWWWGVRLEGKTSQKCDFFF